MQDILAIRRDDTGVSYTARDAALYALAVGAARDPLDLTELPLAGAIGVQPVLPSMATILGIGNSIHLDLPINHALAVHGEQRLVLHRPLPPTAKVDLSSRVTGCIDKGIGRGAVIQVETDVRLATGEALCTLQSTAFARGDGGIGNSSTSAAALQDVPDRPPDYILHGPTRPDQALLYRLTGDRNPLHVDPAVAHLAGFERPILHGLCTYGIVCRVLLKAFGNGRLDTLRAFDARFSAPVFPGDDLTIEVWQRGDTLQFRVRVDQRESVVLSHGRLLLSEPIQEGERR